MSGASAVIHKQNKLIGFFIEAGAVDPEHAIYISDFGINRSFVFDRMVSRGVFIELDPGKFYIDTDMIPVFKTQRRKRALVALIICLLIATLAYLFKGM